MNMANISNTNYSVGIFVGISWLALGPINRIGKFLLLVLGCARLDSLIILLSCKCWSSSGIFRSKRGVQWKWLNHSEPSPANCTVSRRWPGRPPMAWSQLPIWWIQLGWTCGKHVANLWKTFGKCGKDVENMWKTWERCGKHVDNVENMWQTWFFLDV